MLNNNSHLLAIETATEICSVAITRGDEIVANRTVTRSNSHSELLVTMIDECLEISNIRREEIYAIAISDGPGSYTGLRVGSSTAKGLCFALDIPLIAIPTLQALAFDQQGRGIIILSTVDARRMEAYTAIFNDRLEPLAEVNSIIWSDETIQTLSQQYDQIVITGNGIEKAYQLFDSISNIEILPSIPNASTVGILAYQKYQHRMFVDVAYHVPFYYKSPNITQSKKHPLIR